MRRVAATLLVLAAGLALLTGGVARAGYTETDVLRDRLDNTERRLGEALRRIDDLTLLVGRRPAEQEPDRAQVVLIVQEEMEAARKPNDFHVYWKEGLRFNSTDGAFKLKVGGRVMVDWATMEADDDLRAFFGDSEGFNELSGDSELRRARFYMEGEIYDVTNYKLQVDFAGSEVAVKDAWLAFQELLPIGTLKVGHFKEPFGLEELTSSKYITFMERSLPIEAFAPSRNLGFMASDGFLEDRGSWALGVFWENGDCDTEATFEEGVALTGRVTWAPYYADDGAEVVHLGAAASLRGPETARFRSRPEVHLASVRFADTGSISDVDRVMLCDLEAAWVHGPFSLQGECIHASVENGSDAEFSGGYLQGSYFLTGEHRNYKPGSGEFSRVKPANNFDGDGNWGAWEVAARYSYLDLEDSGLEGGELSDVTLGLNWYLNPNVRVMWNYVRTALDTAGVEGNANALMMRFQVDF